jgi:hypothetical protein
VSEALGQLASTPPPALTWVHLLSSDARYVCAGAPDWLNAQLRANCGNGAEVRVVFGDAGSNTGAPLAASRVEQLAAREPTSGTGGLVLINAPASEKQLRNCGFPCVRRFAAIPNLRQLRWLVPLDSPAVSRAAFSLYTPTRLSAKLKRFAVRLVTHTRLPIWYKDHLCIALPEIPPIERTFAQIFPGERIHISLSSGAPEGALNRKASALVISADGRLLAFAKLARSAIARQILANEAAILPALAHLQVPRLLLNAEIDGTRVLAQTPLAGTPAPLALGESHQKFLRSLQTPNRQSAASVEMVKDLRSRLSGESQLLDILDAVMPSLESFDVPVTILHGDFAPWNLRINGGQIAAFDWEYAQLAGLPLVDELHYRLQVGMMLENWDIAAAERAVAGWCEARPMSLEPPQARAIAIVYLLDALARLLGEGYGQQHEMITWHRGLLARLAPAATAAKGRMVAA